MGLVGFILLFTFTYTVGVFAGWYYASGARKAWRKSVMWKSRYKEHLAEMQIKDLAKALRGLSGAFQDSGNSSYERMTREIAATALAETSQRVCEPCGGCHLGRMQLQRDTYYLQYLMSSFSRSGRLDMEDMPRIFSETCCDAPRYMEELNDELGRGQMQIDWKKRFLESREVVVAQFRELEDMLTNLSSAGGERVDLTDQWERAIRRECRHLRLRLGRCYVEEDGSGHREIHLMLQSTGRHCIPAKEVAEALSKVMKRNIKPDNSGKTMIGREPCRILFEDEPVFGVCYGISRAVKDGCEISGDNFSAMDLPGGRYMLCLSDGMGSGHLASAESEAVVELAEHLLEAGFSLEATVKSINAVLLLREGEQRPATLDLHCLNLNTGALSSRKQGAAATFIKRGENVYRLESGDMPIGWNKSVTSEESNRQLDKETYMILMTDGVIEALPGVDKEEFLTEILRRMKGDNPQAMADDILSLSAGQEPPRDDMTVLVAGIQER